MRFLIQPKNVKKNGFDLQGVNVVAIDVTIKQTNFSESKVSFVFDLLYKDENGQFIIKDSVEGFVDKKVSLPNSNHIDFVAGLMSYDKQKVFQTANLMAEMYGYALLPINEQIF
jgi:hypothetical protein